MSDNSDKLYQMRIFTFFLIMIVLFCSCAQINEDENYGGILRGSAPIMIIVDEVLNDRLNPESPTYFGEEYIKGIELSYLHNGERMMVQNAIVSPIHWNEGTRGYYYIRLPKGSTSYISYPDGNEDVITIRSWRNDTGTVTCIDKILFNGELVLEWEREKDATFYNQKFFPWMMSVDFGNGKIQEIPGTDLANLATFVITK